MEITDTQGEFTHITPSPASYLDNVVRIWCSGARSHLVTLKKEASEMKTNTNSKRPIFAFIHGRSIYPAFNLLLTEPKLTLYIYMDLRKYRQKFVYYRKPRGAMNVCLGYSPFLLWLLIFSFLSSSQFPLPHMSKFALYSMYCFHFWLMVKLFSMKAESCLM